MAAKKEEKAQYPAQHLSIEDFAIFCKKKGLVYPSSEIYGGISGFWDYGPLGSELFSNLKRHWWKHFVQDREDVVGIDASIISHPRTWKASGHIDSFSDISVSCKSCKKINKVDKAALDKAVCEFCGGALDKASAKELKLLFTTQVGAENGTTAYLRGETAQGMFLDFKLIMETARTKIPFGIAQVGKCFRNEISPRDFVFRSREFTIAEIEFFFDPEKTDCPLLEKSHLQVSVQLLDADTQEKGKEQLHQTSIEKMLQQKKLSSWHAYWLAEQLLWLKSIGLAENIKVREHTKSELSHYSSATFDLDYRYPFGSEEIAGNANRGQFDLTQHSKESKQNLEVYDEETKRKFLPAVIEPTFGMDRLFLALLVASYHDDKERGNIVLKLPRLLAPITLGIFPLVNKVEPEARKVMDSLKKQFSCFYDRSGSIGRRYARADEIGIPYCITIDFDTEKDGSVTIRDRDTTQQIRVSVKNLSSIIHRLLQGDEFKHVAQS